MEIERLPLPVRVTAQHDTRAPGTLKDKAGAKFSQDHYGLGMLEMIAKPAHVGIRTQVLKRLGHLLHDACTGDFSRLRLELQP